MFKKPKLLPPIRTYEEDYIWEADLMFFTHPAIAKENDGYLYILAIIDTFTKMVMLKKLKNKSTKTITEDVNRLFQREKPKYLRVDMGGEFVSNMFVNMCKKNKVKLYIAMEPIKCAMVERFIRTFKRILVQKMEKEHTLRWIDFVGDCKNIYDNRTHRTIKMTPLEAERKENQKHILRANLKRYFEFDRKTFLKNKKPTKFKRGSFVKIFKIKTTFTKGYSIVAVLEYPFVKGVFILKILTKLPRLNFVGFLFFKNVFLSTSKYVFDFPYVQPLVVSFLWCDVCDCHKYSCNLLQSHSNAGCVLFPSFALKFF